MHHYARACIVEMRGLAAQLAWSLRHRSTLCGLTLEAEYPTPWLFGKRGLGSFVALRTQYNGGVEGGLPLPGCPRV